VVPLLTLLVVLYAERHSQCGSSAPNGCTGFIESHVD
jgi:hypothetical protein